MAAAISGRSSGYLIRENNRGAGVFAAAALGAQLMSKLAAEIRCAWHP